MDGVEARLWDLILKIPWILNALIVSDFLRAYAQCLNWRGLETIGQQNRLDE